MGLLFTKNVGELGLTKNTFPDIVSSEYLSSLLGQWVSGPDLPDDLSGFCVVALNDAETRHLLVGGRKGDHQRLPNSWVYDWEGGQTWQHAGISSNKYFVQCEVFLSG